MTALFWAGRRGSRRDDPPRLIKSHVERPSPQQTKICLPPTLLYSNQNRFLQRSHCDIFYDARIKKNMTAQDESTALRTYRGNCHCGAFVYEAELPEITTVTECSCSICRKKGYLSVSTNEEKHFRVVKGSLDALSEYTFGAKKLRHKVRKVLCDSGGWNNEREELTGG